MRADAKVFPKSVSGFYRRLKWQLLWLLLALYYVAPWLRWDRGAGAPDQAILVDAEQGRLSTSSSIEIWPQEVYYLTGLLIMAAIGLFLVTSLARRGCGAAIACPQTVWTDLFMLGRAADRGRPHARMRLDKAPWTSTSCARRTRPSIPPGF